MWPYAVLTAVGLAGALYADWRGRAWLAWVGKPLASSAFVLAALARGALGSRYGEVLLAALLLSWLGDVLLIPRDKRTFQAGLGSFLLGHVFFTIAFAVRGVAWRWVALSVMPIAGAALLVAAWLLPHVKGPLRGPVIAYVAVISSMVAFAVGSVGAGAGPLGLAAASAFYLSDLSVARNRFVAPGLANRLWGLPLYYAAQLMFAATI